MDILVPEAAPFLDGKNIEFRVELGLEDKTQPILDQNQGGFVRILNPVLFGNKTRAANNFAAQILDGHSERDGQSGYVGYP